MKVCSRCKKELSLDSFYRYNDRYQSTCNPCKTDYNKQEYAKKRERLKRAGW
mgnify:CR=1 FL=1|jgi:hypothetical protein